MFSHARPILFALSLAAISVAASESSSIGVVIQKDAHTPMPWRALTADEQSIFDLGHAVFNTHWTPANLPASRRDGLGPIHNSSSCDSCHNSRRRGRGPGRDGEAPIDLVVQLGTRLSNGNIQRGTDAYGLIINTAAIEGYKPEASVTIKYEEVAHSLADGTGVHLRSPHYTISNLSGPALPPNTVLMPRMPPLVQGVGLLELVPQSELQSLIDAQKTKGISGRISWIDRGATHVIGRFGWQATEPSVASQTAAAFSREMGLTSSLISHIDCGADEKCKSAPTGGDPEVQQELFYAVVFFQQLHAVPRASDATMPGEKLFVKIGCVECHRASLHISSVGISSLGLDESNSQVIHPYTDLLLHDLGEALADRDLNEKPVKSLWRTAPLWGMQAAVASNQPLRLMHDGRARGFEEAILWHDGEAKHSQQSYKDLSKTERMALLEFLESL